MVFSSANYWIGLVIDILGALAFLILGVSFFSGPWLVAGAALAIGFIGWGLLEYALHRFVLHGPSSLPSRGHAQHHEDARALISTPLLVIGAGALAIWGLLGLLLPAGVAALVVFGMYSGYNYFALLHHLHHQGNATLERLAYLRRLRGVHELHHRLQTVNYGTTTTIWDRLFGTFRPAA
jgi:sterol desaturase/sphingolipid hydroxylase (fatty acid hydroxylase superfamily)